MKEINVVIVVFYLFVTARTDPIDKVNLPSVQTRRILRGTPAGDTRPYMVYLRPSTSAEPEVAASDWLCGGVIVHERYILTSAACIEEAKQFYVVAGTNKWVPATDDSNECIKNGAKRAVWKCVPKNYYFDGAEFNNIQWMSYDIAVVKVEDDFNFSRRVRGCDYIPQKIAFNNHSASLERAKTEGSTAGWGSTDSFEDLIFKRSTNSPELLETDVVILSKKNCKKRWDPRYHHIIDQSMICVKDDMDTDAMSSVCADHEVNCKELIYTDNEDEDDEENAKEERRKVLRRFIVEPGLLEVHSADHNRTNATRRTKTISGGFCENDHGGPLVVGRGKSAVVVGIISACLTRDITKKCYGPFLYTSVWKHRNLISCAIDKEIGATCRRFLRMSRTQMSETTFDWSKHPKGSARQKTNETSTTFPKKSAKSTKKH